MSLHPEILKLTDRLFPLIGAFLKNKEQVSMVELAKFLKDKKIDGLTFRGTHSYQLEYILTNLVRCGLVDENGSLISLSSYGKEKLEAQK